MKKIGIVGYGTIGSAVAKAIKEKFSDRAELVAVYDIDKKKATVSSMEKLVSAVDLVVETASPQAVRELVPIVIKKGKEILVLSTGGLLGFMPLQKGIYFPSGAIAGLDGLSAASVGRIDKITLTTTKPQKALGDKTYDKDTVVFEGKVEDAVKRFPFNINVCATLTLAGREPVVRIIASPTIKRNTHEIVIEGDFGRMTFRMENEPSPDNPKTSYLAVLSAITKLRDILYG